MNIAELIRSISILVLVMIGIAALGHIVEQSNAINNKINKLESRAADFEYKLHNINLDRKNLGLKLIKK